MSEKLSQHDARITAAGLSLAVAIVGAGVAGRELVGVLGEVDPQAGLLIDSALAMLARSEDGADLESPISGSGEKFADNMVRVKQLARLLLGKDNAGVEVDLPPVEVATDVDKNGAEIAGTKRYALWVTHDELHLLHWALKTAEAVAKRSPAFIQNGGTYARLRSEVVDNEAFSRFVDKFDNVHQQARIDDGEELGVKSDATPAKPQPETPPQTA
jgi:hypothetical protein